MKLATRAVLTLGLVAALGGALVACGGGGTPTTSTSKVSADAAEFTFTPSALEAKAGDVLEVTLVNKGTIEHDLTIDALGIKAYAAVGKTATATTEAALTAGTYEFYCSIAGHKEAGMVGTLTVK
jgi:plastocyanin